MATKAKHKDGPISTIRNPFFYVKYGQDKTDMFNAGCTCVVLLSHIRQACGYSNIDKVDLIPINFNDKGVVPLSLMEHSQQYATDYIKDRGHYVLLKISEDEDSVKEYTPLWETEDATRLKGILDAKTSGEKKKAASGKGKKK
eukprot:NODE_10241_length_529_cov_49.793103_g9594_i0.p1 GENE.NODE_10241_length_529_cov_49.793103_g9594_i0~~NODE_10241_length_529_cov_49.793103_g9594_i0.p1  ORF type:complete len:143 (-),score=25.36 NODE_10241_length_529_cov_49.793103_g9594_i0:69-497(-)